MRSPFAPAAALALLMACDAQVTTSYRGEPLGTLQGVLVADGASNPRTVELVLLWLAGGKVLPRVIGEVTLGQGRETPFALELHEAPPATFVNACDAAGGSAESEGALGFAWIAAASSGALREEPLPLSVLSALEQDRRLLGASGDRVLVWVEREAAPDTNTSAVLGGTLPPGAYLMAPSGGRLWLLAADSSIRLGLSGTATRLPTLPVEACVPTIPQSVGMDSLTVSGGATTIGWGQMR